MLRLLQKGVSEMQSQTDTYNDATEHNKDTGKGREDSVHISTSDAPLDASTQESLENQNRTNTYHGTVEHSADACKGREHLVHTSTSDGRLWSSPGRLPRKRNLDAAPDVKESREHQGQPDTYHVTTERSTGTGKGPKHPVHLGTSNGRPWSSRGRLPRKRNLDAPPDVKESHEYRGQLDIYHIIAERSTDTGKRLEHPVHIGTSNGRPRSGPRRLSKKRNLDAPPSVRESHEHRVQPDTYSITTERSTGTGKGPEYPVHISTSNGRSWSSPRRLTRKRNLDAPPGAKESHEHQGQPDTYHVITGRNTDTGKGPEHPVHIGTPKGGLWSRPGRLPRKRNLSLEAIDASTPNIVIFGETGVGKSSIINLIADQTLARTSNDAIGCTFEHDRHLIMLEKMSCALWDTAGLDEGSEGTVPAEKAESNLKQLIQELTRSGGIHLVIYCIRCTRLTRALKRNYDLFYMGVCRKKVPIALVVTGLEYQRDKMETWWTSNEATLRRNGMSFDDHACVTTVTVEDPSIQERRLESRKLLQEIVVKYSGLPAWKTDLSFTSRVLTSESFRSILRGSSTTASLENTTSARKVIICGSFAEYFPVTTAAMSTGTCQIGDRRYEVTQVDIRALDAATFRPLEGGGGMLVFYTSSLENNRIRSSDVNSLEVFYKFAGGQTCPMVVILRGCDDDQIAQACQLQVASCHSDIHARFVPFPSTDDARVKLAEMIERLYTEQLEEKTHQPSRRQRLLRAAARALTPYRTR